MNKLKSPQNNPSKFRGLSNISCFNARYLISKNPDNFLQDSSLQKQLITKRLKEKKARLLRQRHSIAEENLESLKKQLIQFRSKMQDQDFQLNLNFHIKRLKMIQFKSAIKIQSVVRGWLTRLHLESILLKSSKEKMQSNLFSMSQIEKHCLLNIGARLTQSAVKIQKFFRRFRFLKKIKRLSQAYSQHLESIKEPHYLIIKKTIRRHLARLTLFEIRFEKEKTLKLEKIRKKLAILKIRKIFKKKKITFKVIKAKVRKFRKLSRYSNRFSLNKSPFESKGNLELIEKKHKSVILSPSKDMLGEESTNFLGLEVLNLPLPETFFNAEQEVNQSKAETLVFKKPVEIKRKKKKVLLMKKVKDINLIPLLYQRELEDRPNTHHFMRTTASISRMLEATPTRSPPKFVNKYRIRMQSSINNFSR